MSEEGGGVTDKAKGLMKEAAGAVTGKDDMKAEGRAEREQGKPDEDKDVRTLIRESVRRSRREA